MSYLKIFLVKGKTTVGRGVHPPHVYRGLIDTYGTKKFGNLIFLQLYLAGNLFRSFYSFDMTLFPASPIIFLFY